MERYLCNEGNCGMFEEMEFQTCCIFCENKDNCQGICGKIYNKDFKNEEDVINCNKFIT